MDHPPVTTHFSGHTDLVFPQLECIFSQSWTLLHLSTLKVKENHIVYAELIFPLQLALLFYDLMAVLVGVWIFIWGRSGGEGFTFILSITTMFSLRKTNLSKKVNMYHWSHPFSLKLEYPSLQVLQLIEANAIMINFYWVLITVLWSYSHEYFSIIGFSRQYYEV